MKKQFLLLLLLDLCMSSCTNEDFAYNEQITSNFYACKARLDDKHRKLFKGGFDQAPSDSLAYETELKEAKHLATYTLETKNETSQLEHSAAADVFHANVLTYMATIADDYTPLLIRYVETQDEELRKSLRLQLETRRDALSALEDKCQEAQVAFPKKAGIKINTESARQN